jgi:hypothetical protein
MSRQREHLGSRNQLLNDVAVPLLQAFTGDGFKERDANVRSLSGLAVLRLNRVEERCPQMSGIPHIGGVMSAIPLGHGRFCHIHRPNTLRSRHNGPVTPITMDVMMMVQMLIA